MAGKVTEGLAKVTAAFSQVCDYVTCIAVCIETWDQYWPKCLYQILYYHYLFVVLLQVFLSWIRDC